MKNTESKRLNYIDIVKGLAIFSVVLGHVYRGNVVQNWIYSFHMPLFFFVSGWLLNAEHSLENGYKFFVVKKIRKFLIPYMFFLLVNYAYWCVIESHFRLFDQGPLWFLPVLCVVECGVVGLIKICKNDTQFLIVTIVFVLLLIWLGGDAIGEYGSIMEWVVRWINGTMWYCIGFCSRKNIRMWCEESLNKSKKKWLYIVSLFLLSVILGCINGRVDMYLNRFNNVFIYIIAAILGIYLYIGISILIGKCKIVEYLGRYSLIIMCTHEPIKRAVIQVISILTHISSDIIRNNIVGGFLIAIITTLIELLVIYVFHILSRVTVGKKVHIFFEYAE